MSTKWTVVAGTGGKRAPTAAVKEANSKKIGSYMTCIKYLLATCYLVITCCMNTAELT